MGQTNQCENKLNLETLKRTFDLKNQGIGNIYGRIEYQGKFNIFKDIWDHRGKQLSWNG